MHDHNQSAERLAHAPFPPSSLETEDATRLRRWLVEFSSGAEWFSVGEFVALSADAAIERAIEVFGAGAAHRAEEIPWDAAPLNKSSH